MYQFFIFVAAGCLLLNLLAHGSTFAGVNLLQQIPGFWWVPLVTMIVFCAALVVGQKLVNKTLNQKSPEHVLHYSPPWLLTVVYVFCLYAGFNFYFTHFSLLEGGLPRRINGEKVLASHGKVIRKLTREEYERAQVYVGRAVSGHLMPFSSASLLILIASRAYRQAARLRGLDPEMVSEPANRKPGNRDQELGSLTDLQQSLHSRRPNSDQP